jgi:hypothetical protein
VGSANIVYRPRPHTTRDSQVTTLISVYRFLLLESSAGKKVARPGDPDYAKDLENGRTANENSTE